MDQSRYRMVGGNIHNLGHFKESDDLAKIKNVCR